MPGGSALSLGQGVENEEFLCAQGPSCLPGLCRWGKQLFCAGKSPEAKRALWLLGYQRQAQGRGEVRDTLASSWALVLNKF